MAETSFTDAQRRALLWLPADGKWQVRPYRTMLEVFSLWIARPDLVEHRCGPYGKFDETEHQYRLTPAGIEARRQIAKEAQG